MKMRGRRLFVKINRISCAKTNICSKPSAVSCQKLSAQGTARAKFAARILVEFVFELIRRENRLDMISLVHGIIKEQSFSAIASSYLKEAHAIAYLDGTLAYLNRQMRHLAKLDSRRFHRLTCSVFCNDSKPTFSASRNWRFGAFCKRATLSESELYFSETK
jgi:hypothetical protein